MNEENGLTTPNGGAYEKTETRNGPPLDYVAEKLRFAIERLHSAHHGTKSYIPDNLPMPSSAPPDHCTNARDCYSLHDIDAAFRYAITAYLALNNLLAIANDHKFLNSIVEMSREQLRQWLDNIDREGSVT